MNRLFDALLPGLPFIGPTRWTDTAHRLRNADGWVTPMMIIAALGVVLFGNALIVGIMPKWLAIAVRLTTVGPLLVVSCIASLWLMRDSYRNVRRFGICGLVRARPWFELARLSFISFVIVWLVFFVATFTGFLALIPNMTSTILCCSLVVFLVATTVGYGIAFTSRSKPHGKAAQCAGFFYPLFLAGILVFALAMCFRGNQNAILVALTGLVGISLTTAAALALYSQTKSTGGWHFNARSSAVGQLHEVTSPSLNSNSP